MRLELSLPTLAVVGVLCALSPGHATAAEHWPQFRGPDAAGVSANASLPDKWSATENVVWKRDLLNPHHPTPTGDSWAGGPEKQIPVSNRAPGTDARLPGHRRLECRDDN